LSARHLLGIEGMNRSAIEALLDQATRHKAWMGEGKAPPPSLAGKVIANAFFEDSTRTRSSFEMAAKALGAEVINWTTRGGSVSKGETLLDTVRNLDALGLYALVMRHPSSGAPHLVAQHVRCAVVNAGDGTHEHPSQGLLDSFTLRERLGSLDGKRVAIVGDILHSRVARSNLHCLQALGAHVVLCGPPTLLPVGVQTLGPRVSTTTQLDAALEGADAVMMLRIQLERQSESLFPTTREYARQWGLSVARAHRMKPGAFVMHPGPINRGLELAAEVADGGRSLILDQVTNGVAVRRAILEACA
jgi:aspartate carbamoyltransferase catalytic subunit